MEKYKNLDRRKDFIDRSNCRIFWYIQWLLSSATNSLLPDTTFNLWIAIPVGLVGIMATPSHLFYTPPYAQNVCKPSFIKDLESSISYKRQMFSHIQIEMNKLPDSLDDCWSNCSVTWKGYRTKIFVYYRCHNTIVIFWIP